MKHILTGILVLCAACGDPETAGSIADHIDLVEPQACACPPAAPRWVLRDADGAEVGILAEPSAWRPLPGGSDMGELGSTGEPTAFEPLGSGFIRGLSYRTDDGRPIAQRAGSWTDVSGFIGWLDQDCSEPASRLQASRPIVEVDGAVWSVWGPADADGTAPLWTMDDGQCVEVEPYGSPVWRWRPLPESHADAFQRPPYSLAVE